MFEYEHSKAFPGLTGSAIRTNYGVMALDLLRVGTRSAYLPDQVANSNVARHPLYRVDGAPVFERNLYAVYRSASTSIALIEQLIEVITGLGCQSVSAD